MKNKWYGYLYIMMACYVCVCIFAVKSKTASAAEAKLVKIQPAGEGKLVAFYIDPPVLYIEKGTIVVWLSGIVGKDIQVVFMEGKTCKDVTSNPNTFIFDKDHSCYVASEISYGETSTLQFEESGTYQYYVATEGGQIKAKGKIIVRKY